MNRRAQIAPSVASRALRAVLATALVFSSWTLFVKDESPAAPKTSIYDAIDKARTQLDDKNSEGGAPKALRLLQQERLDAAKQIVETMNQTQATALDRAVALSKQSFKAQAASLGIDLPAKAPETPRHDSPTEAIRALMATQDLKLSEADQDKAKALDELPGSIKQPLTDVIDTFVGFQSACRTAISTLAAQLGTEAENQDQAGITDPKLKVEMGNLLASRAEFLDASRQLGDALSMNRTAAAEDPPIQLPPGGDDSLGVISIELTGTPTTYTRDFILVIDAGGGDTYHNNAGGRHKPSGTPTSCLNATEAILSADPNRIAGIVTTDALLDFGADADSYGDPGNPRTCGANGGGNFGSGFLLDGGGGDTYSAAGLHTETPLVPSGGEGGTNGGAHVGTGLVLDAGGQDRYLSEGTGANGGVFRVGTGLLIDAGPEGDHYIAGKDGVRGSFGVNGGGAFTAGFGFVGMPPSGGLVDAGGGDKYLTGQGGVNGGAVSTARGMLIDGGGDDEYRSNLDPTNCGTSDPRPPLSTSCIGSNGGAGSLSAGLLLDAAGNDLFTGPGGAVNGGATGGSAVLLDGQGNDDYHAEQGGVNGGASSGSALLVDGTGDDCYKATGTSSSNGGGGNPAGLNLAVGAALLFDASGYDTYWVPSGDSNAKSDNQTTPVKGAVGAQVDAGVAPPPPSPLPCDSVGATTTTSSTSTSTSSTSTTSTSSTSTTTSTTSTTSSTTTTTTPDGFYAQDQSWVRHTAPVPVPTFYPEHRERVAMGFHEPTGRTVLFGGWKTSNLSNDRALQDTWTWDGVLWEKKETLSAPEARYGAAMAYLGSAKQLVLFGGFKSDGTALKDTWVWEGDRWSQKFPSINPPARGDAGMAEDKIGKNLVLFGGVDQDADSTEWNQYGDTWTWDGNKWTQQETNRTESLSARHGATMVTDASGRPMLFGGISGTSRIGDIRTYYGDTWTWEGSDWRRRYKGETYRSGLTVSGSGWDIAPEEPIQPTPRYGAGLAFHESAAEVVLFGGFVRRNGLFSPYNDPGGTWTWDGARWELRNPAESPSADNEFGRPYTTLASFREGPKEEVVLFGEAPGELLESEQHTKLVQGPSTWTWDARKSTSGTGGTSVNISLDPTRIPADGGSSTSKVTVTYIENHRGLPGRETVFTTNGDVWFEPDRCTTDTHGRCSILVHSSFTPGIERINAHCCTGILGANTYIPSAVADLTEEAAECSYDPSVEEGPPGWWGKRDPAFGCNGRVLHRVGPKSYAEHLIIQRDEHLVVAATPYLVRYTPDGDIDKTFGSSGVVKFEGDPVRIAGLAFQPNDGRILVTYSRWNEQSSRWTDVMARLMPNGKLDRDFGSSGEVALPQLPGYDSGYLPAIQSDRKIVLVSTPDFTVHRYDEKGSLDPEFGNNGKAVTRVRPSGWTDEDPPFFNTPEANRLGWVPRYHSGPSAIRIDQDEKIVIGGVWTTGQGTADWDNNIIFARFFPSGDLDPEFNPCTPSEAAQPCGGKQMTDFDERVFLHDIALQRDGRIVFAARAFGSYRSILGRYKKDGTLDPEFNKCEGPPEPPSSAPRKSVSCGGSRLDTNFGHGGLAIQEDQKILTAGSTERGMSVARFKQDGTPEDDCGAPWVTETPFGKGAAAMAVSVQEDQKIVAAGYAGGGGIGMVRYRGGGEPPPEPTTITVEGATVKEPTGGATEAPFKIKLELDAPACEKMGFDYATSDGSANAGSDYVATNGRVMFEKGQQHKIIEVPVLGDETREPPENFYLKLSSAGSVQLPEGPRAPWLKDVTLPVEVARGEAQILDEETGARPVATDQPPGLSIGDTSVIEGNQGLTKASFAVVLNKPSKQKVTVKYVSHDDSAKAPGDFQKASASVTFNPGETQKTAEVEVVTDVVPEATEAFSVSLEDPQGAKLIRPKATGTIYDDDPAAGPEAQNRNPSRASTIPTAAGLLMPGANLPPPGLVQGTQIQSQQQIQQQIQQQAQAQLMAGVMSERQRQAEIEKAGLQGKDAYLATARRQTSPVAAWAFAWLGALAAFGTALAFRKQTSGETAKNPLRRPKARQ